MFQCWCQSVVHKLFIGPTITDEDIKKLGLGPIGTTGTILTITDGRPPGTVIDLTAFLVNTVGDFGLEAANG